MRLFTFSFKQMDNLLNCHPELREESCGIETILEIVTTVALNVILRLWLRMTVCERGFRP